MSRIAWDEAHPFFSFGYGGETSAALLPQWAREESTEPSPGGQTRHLSFADPTTGMKVTAHLRRFDAFEALDWVLEYENQGSKESPLLEDILPLDVSWPLDATDAAILHYAKGSTCQVDDFEPVMGRITPRRDIRLSPTGGRSSNGVMPFTNLQLPAGGLVLAIGWTGQWAAHWWRDAGRLYLQAGMERTHLRLRPGEKIRTPRMLVVNWEGSEAIRGNNALRQLILAHYTPKDSRGDIVMPPIAHNSQATYYFSGRMSEEGELATAKRAAQIGIEAYWIDAAWYGEQRKHADWPHNLGNWYYRQDAFPRGLEPLGEECHRLGMEFVVWFEPERVYKESVLAREHPEYLLWYDRNPDYALYNLGMPEAREYMTDLLSRIITESKIDVYRQDFNVDPLPYWSAADSEDRLGFTESRYIEGLYWMWDELRRRHPGLAIDNCSSGGRRIDLEMTSRSYPLWRSDFSDVGGPKEGPWLQIGDQVQTAGLSRWVPLHAGAVWTFTPYAFRSAMSAGVVPYSDILAPDFPEEQARQAIAEAKSLRPLYQGDLYPLTPTVMASHDWCAYQFDRPDLGEGFAVFLRRHNSPFPTMEARLQRIEPGADYEVGLSETFVAAAPKRMRGSELANLTITLGQSPASVLLRYRRLG